MKRAGLLFLSAMVSMHAYCGVGEFSGETTCHIYHQDTLLKSLTCPYEGVEGASITYGFKWVTYTLKGYGVMETSTSVDGFDADGNPTGLTNTVNDEPAIIRFRSSTTHNIIGEAYAENVLECYKSIKSGWEICAPSILD